MISSQLRQKIGVAFGNPETTTGGNALKFYASVRLDIRRIGRSSKGESVVARGARQGRQNKLAPPFRAEFELLYGVGVNRSGLLDLAASHGLVKKSGAWYSLEGERLAQGRERAALWLAEHPVVMESLRERLLAALRRGEVSPRSVTPAEDAATADEEASNKEAA